MTSAYTPLEGLREIRVEGQKILPSGAALPFSASEPEGISGSLGDYVALGKRWAASGALQKTLDTHGAILLRGLPIYSADDFSKLLHAFGVSRPNLVLTSY